MKCPNCFNIIMTPFQCKDCPDYFCSLSCLELHYSNYHLNNNNNIKKNYSQNQHKIKSPFLVKGIFNDTIIYDSIYSLENFEPVFEQDGKIKTIGGGSYGQVYLGLHKITKKYYAIKHMDKKNILDLLHSLSAAQQEIEIQSKTDHPNIVKLLYVRETEESYDLIMEYAPGGNLFHFIRKTKGLSEIISFNLFIQVVNAINFLHENDLIHRDIKPENILIFENDIVKLCDFGWCVKLDGKQRGTFCGTTEYMSPELVNRVGYGKEIDVWSLGVLLYEMIHGYSPFRPNKPEFDEKDVMENIINHDINFEKNISPECQKLIYGLLDPNIKNRYKVEDIYNSEFVKKYEQIFFGFPNNNTNFNNQNQIQSQAQNQINNIVYSPQIEMNNNINIHMSMDLNNYVYNIQIPEKNKNVNYEEKESLKEKNKNMQKINKSIYSNYINASNNQGNLINNSIIDNSNNNYYISNLLENKLTNIKDNLASVINISNLSNNDINCNQDNLNTKRKLDSFYTINLGKNKEQEFVNTYTSHNNESYQNDKRDNKEFINFNNSILYLSGQNNNNIFNKIINEKNNNLQLNNINYSQLLQKNDLKEDKSTIEILNGLNKNIIDNLSYDNNISNINNSNLTYNYYNNIINNYINNNNKHYPSIQASLIKRTHLIPNSNFNFLNYDSNSNNKNFSISSIPSTSTKIISEGKNKQNENNKNNININLISKSSIFPQVNKKISEFEIEDNKYINDRNINENQNIKIEINPCDDFLNDKKSLSSSGIFNQKINHTRIIKEKEPNDNIFGKRIDKPEEVNIKNNSINMSVNVNTDNNILKNNYFISNYTNGEEYNIPDIQLKKNLSVCNIEKKEYKINNNINIINELKVPNIPISKIINFDQPKEYILKEEDASRNFQLPKSKSFCDNDLIKNMKKNKKNKNFINKDIKERQNLTNDKIKQKKKKLVNYLYRNKNDDSKNILKDVNKINENEIINKNENINKKETKEQMDTSFSDASCSLINVLWSKREKKEKKEKKINKINNKTSNSMMNKIPIKDPLILKSQDKIPKNSKINNLRKKSPIGKSKLQNDKIGEISSCPMGLTPNAKSFIKFSSNNNINYKNEIKIGNINFDNNNSGNKYINYLKICKTSDETKIIQKNRGDQPYINYGNNLLCPVKRDNQNLLKPSCSLNSINQNQKIKMNNININPNIPKIQFKKNKSKDISYDYNYKNIRKLNIQKEYTNNDTESNVIINTSEYNDTNDERNKTPKKKSIFNKIKPNILLAAFKKEKSNIFKLNEFKNIK